MAAIEGSLARKLDFEDLAAKVTSTGGARGGLRLAPSQGGLSGPDKYRVLEQRRRQAQISARHLLDIMDLER